MNRLIIVLILILAVSGCSSTVDTIKTDYLKADDFDESTMSVAMETIKKDYLKDEETRKDRKKKLLSEFLAQRELLNSEYKYYFRVDLPEINNDAGMPETTPFIFIHFRPLEGVDGFPGRTYLVVIRRFNNQIVYSGLFIPPEGDPFYRYAGILKIIGR